MPHQPFLALITPLSGEGGGGGGGQPPGIWGPTDPRPTHPIAGFPWPGQPSQPGVPTHPIYNPPYPDIGLPGGQPYPDQGLPGSQPRPDQGLPGNQPYPDQGLPGRQPGIWGPNDPRPTPPIYIPGQPVIPEPGDPTKAHIIVYVPGKGAVKFLVDLTTLPQRPDPTEPAPKEGQ